MDGICNSILRIIAAVILALAVITYQGETQYRQDYDNMFSATKKFLDEHAVADKIDKFQLAELKSAVSSCNGVYELQVNKYTIVTNATPDGGTYISEYLGTLDDDLYSDDRIEVKIKVRRFPLAMTALQGFVGVGGTGRRVLNMSINVR